MSFFVSHSTKSTKVPASNLLLLAPLLAFFLALFRAVHLTPQQMVRRHLEGQKSEVRRRVRVCRFAHDGKPPALREVDDVPRVVRQLAATAMWCRWPRSERFFPLSPSLCLWSASCGTLHLTGRAHTHFSR